MDATIFIDAKLLQTTTQC